MLNTYSVQDTKGFLGSMVVKNIPANAGDTGSIPGSGRFPGEGNGNPLQSSCRENPMNKGASSVHGVAKSQTQLSHFTFIFSVLSLARLFLQLKN